MTIFRAITWNVENLFTPKPDAPIEEHTQYAFKINLIANLIQELEPDVVGFQEVGGEEPMQDLQVALNHTYPHQVVSSFPDRRGILVAFLSKLPVTAVEEIVDFPSNPATLIFRSDADGPAVAISRMGRGALMIQVEKANLSIKLVNAHLKSKLLTFKTETGRSSFSPLDEHQRAQETGIALHRRTAEALTLRLHINRWIENQDAQPLLLMGDFNDVPEAQTSLLLTGPTGSEIGTRGFNRSDQGDDARLFNLAALIPQARRFSRIHHGRKELLDQFFASEELFPRDAAGERSLPLVDSLIDYNQQLPSIADNPNLRSEEITPDHAPVVCTFTL
ncbi:MAG TPA: hypothetical protein DCY42_05675 [Chloroflexi bacterium]|nr:hypothetical protein [Chloroflexota bacterium]